MQELNQTRHIHLLKNDFRKNKAPHHLIKEFLDKKADGKHISMIPLTTEIDKQNTKII